MSKVVMDVSMSLDGFSAGPNVRPEAPMGDGGELLHDWFLGTGQHNEVDVRVGEELNAMVGAAIVGRHTFELGRKLWGGTPWPATPTFVVTHRPRADLAGDNGGTFAFDGLEAGTRRAKEAAGDKNVMVLGANVGQSLLRAGLLDELWVHLIPRLLGEGTRLFDGFQAELIPAGDFLVGSVPHLRYRIG
ncbi:dihydrofolate reductase family protein [Kribbella deserti]|uniref:Dihydrofolate reductase family protein n=1 Tax=Kribbella deserti TaxID=1926257 RepID=A0ABV6QG53_9ACTN